MIKLVKCNWRLINLSKDKCTNLRVSVTKHYRDLFNHNFEPAVIQAKKEMERWSTLPLSMAESINSVTMVILPKFLFLLQTIPLLIAKSFFKEMDRPTSLYICNKKIPRIRKECLERWKKKGGLTMPNYRHYY